MQNELSRSPQLSGKLFFLTFPLIEREGGPISSGPQTVLKSSSVVNIRLIADDLINDTRPACEPRLWGRHLKCQRLIANGLCSFWPNGSWGLGGAQDGAIAEGCR